LEDNKEDSDAGSSAVSSVAIDIVESSDSDGEEINVTYYC
jgi:hypothetical protein